ncbi:MAG: 16S rRNA (cytosine(1402)-N(4))-methyltransferase RsmH [Xanthomonadales bacterium]|nr:16S rRNA (cytosine(1402)-N(4))-methyltransferase RsmH [Xanthomonadales bacterium]
MTADAHQPVLLDAALDALMGPADGHYCDATFGRGGHSGALLQRLSPAGRLLAIDKDPQAVRVAAERFSNDPRFQIWRGSFADLETALAQCGMESRLDGVLMDLGVSSPQLDEAARGFSFLRDGPLDMRMDPDSGHSAAEWIAVAGEDELAQVIRTLGEERFARRIARAIVSARQQGAIETTQQLAQLVAAAIPTREAGKDPATRTFQAIRIHINRELDDLQSGLDAALECLKPGGRLVVISFHSLEDRLVKRFIRGQSGAPGSRRLPPGPEARPRLRALGKVVKASEQEINVNPRARSAVMRVAEKCAG